MIARMVNPGRITAPPASGFPRVSGLSAWPASALPNMAAWWDASRPDSLYQDSALSTPAVAPGDVLGGIADVFGGTYPLTATTKPTLAKGALNGRDGIAYNGSTQWSNANGVAALVTGTDQPFTVWAVFKLAAFSGAIACFGKASAAALPSQTFDYSSTGFFRSLRRDDAALQPPTATAPFATGDFLTPHLCVWSYSGTAVTISFDGRILVYQTPLDVGATTLDVFSVGAIDRNGARGTFANAVIGTVAVHTAAFPDLLHERLASGYARPYWGTP